MMRMVRLPYFYLPDGHVTALYASSYRLLCIINDVHHNRPNVDWDFPQVKPFMYHPAFLRWVFAKSKAERLRRGLPVYVILNDEIMNLKSRPLEEFVPPTEQELAEDVVWLLEKWRRHYSPTGQLLPQSYIELVELYYGYTPQQAAVQRIDTATGRHRDADSGWYHTESEAPTT